MKILLVSRTQIINKIFSLISARLNLELDIKDNIDINLKYDIIILDEEFIDDSFNFIKQYTKRIGAISKKELPFDKSIDFIIKRPFLPTDLESLLKTEINSLVNEEINNNQVVPDDTDINVIDYIDSLEDEVDYVNDIDESLITLESMDNGGILDGNELSKINVLLTGKDSNTENELDEDDWKNLSDIIDDALTEVQEYEFDMPDEKELHLVLSHYKINELKPLLSRFNQKIFEKLSNGEIVDLKLSLKA